MGTTRMDYLKVNAVVGTAAGTVGFELVRAYAGMRALKNARASETLSTLPYFSMGCGVVTHTQGDAARNVTPTVAHVEGESDQPRLFGMGFPDEDQPVQAARERSRRNVNHFRTLPSAPRENRTKAVRDQLCDILPPFTDRHRHERGCSPPTRSPRVPCSQIVLAEFRGTIPRGF